MSQRAQRSVTIILILISSAVFLFHWRAATTTSAQTGPVEKSRGTPVAELFNSNCARCHGADGAGDTAWGQEHNAPDFTDPDWWRKHSDLTGTKSLVAIVTNGKGEMPAFGKKLTRTQMRQLVSHVQKFRKRISSPK